MGIDTESFEVALKNNMRQAPDVIMIGEIRSRDTMEHALAFAETGHLCLATLHANNANQALDRIIQFFPADRHSQTWMDLSLISRASSPSNWCPPLMARAAVRGDRGAAQHPLVADLIRKGEVHELKAADEEVRRAGHADLRPVALRALS